MARFEYSVPGANSPDMNTEVFTLQKKMGKVPDYGIPPGYASITYFPSLKCDLDFSMLKANLVWNVLCWIDFFVTSDRKGTLLLHSKGSSFCFHSDCFCSAFLYWFYNL